MNFMMKKGVFPRIAAVLMILTLLSTCAISGTFAKYVTTGSAVAKGRVAKWGVTIDASGATSNGYPFKSSYDADTESQVDYITGEAIEKTVVSVDNAGVFAPGTSGSLGAIGVSGTPEVAVEVSYADTTVELGDDSDWTVITDAESEPEGHVYCPLIFTIGDKTIYMGAAKDGGGTIETIADLEAAIVAAITNFSATYAPGTDLANLGDDVTGEGGATIEWAWPFDSAAAAELRLDGYTMSDKEDTLLAAKGPSITFTLTVTVEQVD